MILHQTILSALENARAEFEAATKGTDLVFEREKSFALEALSDPSEKSDFIRSVAVKNPASLTRALVNVAATGMTLNPAEKLAYLLPRRGRIILDISYNGIIKIATDSGSLLRVYAELVYSNDRFKYKGKYQTPEHVFDPFLPENDRGAFHGAYCVATLPDSTEMVSTISAEDISKVMKYSKGSNGESNPWVVWFSRMVRKSVLKRGFGDWPRTDSSSRMAHAIHVLNEHEGLTLNQPLVRDEPEDEQSMQESVTYDSDESKVADTTKAKIKQIIKIARQKGTWDIARDYVRSKVAGNDLAYCLNALDEAKADDLSKDQRPEAA